MNTTENNKIIAEFMGWKLGHPDLFELRWSNEWFDDRNKKTTKGYLHFHSDWNWLMEVVEKIENTSFGEQNYKFQVLIQNNQCSIEQSNLFNTKRHYGKNKIQAVYSACVEFIKWYNEQKL